MKQIIVSILISVIALSAAAQTTNPKAQAIIEKAVSTLKSGALQTTFTVAFKDSQQDAETSQKGIIKLQDTKFYFELADIITYFDGTTQWVYMPKINEVTISEPSKEELKEISPILAMGDYAKTHRAGFDADDSDANYHHVNLYPNDNSADYFRIQLKIDKKTNELKSMRISQRNGGRITLNLGVYQKITPTTETFTFLPSKYPKVEINDMR